MRKILDLTLGIPTYNAGRFLDETFSSITRQSCAPRHIIFTDNCSTDDSVARIQAFIRQNPDLNVSCAVNEANLGVGGNYNRLIEKCGDTTWFQILDSDDCFEQDYWSFLRGDLEGSSDVDLIITGVRTNSVVVNAYILAVESALSALRVRSMPEYLQVLGGVSGRSSLIYRTTLIKKVKFIDPIFDGSDIIHMNQFIARNVWRPHSKVRYRIHADSTTSRLHRDKARLRMDAKKYLQFVNSLSLGKRASYIADYILRKKIGALLRLR